MAYIPPDEGPCQRNPCGINAECREQNGAGSCTCLTNFYGDPHSECRPECVMNNDCPMSRACINTKCQDPCPGACGVNAQCHVVNHSPICTCLPGYQGRPFESCNRIPPSMHQLKLSFLTKTILTINLFFLNFKSCSRRTYLRSMFTITMWTVCTVP